MGFHTVTDTFMEAFGSKETRSRTHTMDRFFSDAAKGTLCNAARDRERFWHSNDIAGGAQFDYYYMSLRESDAGNATFHALYGLVLIWMGGFLHGDIHEVLLDAKANPNFDLKQERDKRRVAWFAWEEDQRQKWHEADRLWMMAELLEREREREERRAQRLALTGSELEPVPPPGSPPAATDGGLTPFYRHVPRQKPLTPEFYPEKPAFSQTGVLYPPLGTRTGPPIPGGRGARLVTPRATSRATMSRATSRGASRGGAEPEGSATGYWWWCEPLSLSS